MPGLPEAAEWWDQVSAWGTLGAVIVALFVAVNEGRRRRLDKEDSDASQARMITVKRYFAGVEITNHSLMPILDLKVSELRIADGSHEGWEGLSKTVSKDGLRAEVVAPGESARVSIDQFRRPGSTVIELQRRLNQDDSIKCTFTFTDAQGLRWTRLHQSQPERIVERRGRRLRLWRRR